MVDAMEQEPQVATDRYRLGPFRRNKRDYSEHQRSAGLDAGDRMKINFFSKYASRLLFLYCAERDLQLNRLKNENGISELEALVSFYPMRRINLPTQY